MAKTDTNTAIQLIQEGIEHRIAEQVENEIVQRMINEFESKARVLVRAEAERITVDNVALFIDHLEMSETIAVALNWVGESCE